MSNALIIVDVQNDFCEGGSMGVDGGTEVARGITRLLADGPEAAGFDHVVATQDWHIDPGAHFSDAPDFVDSWPVHCVAGSEGAAIHPDWQAVSGQVEAWVRKGRYDAAYSGFEGRALAPSETERPEPGRQDELPGTPLAQWLREAGVDGVTVVGIATDYCVRATALDAARDGFDTTVRPDLCAAVHPSNVGTVLDELREAGVTVS